MFHAANIITYSYLVNKIDAKNNISVVNNIFIPNNFALGNQTKP